MALTKATHDVINIPDLSIAIANDTTAGGVGTAISTALTTRAPLISPAFTGTVALKDTNSSMINGDYSSSLSISSIANSAGDTGMAMMSFVVPNLYGIKMGIRGDGYFGIGGHSSAAWRWYSDTNGNMVASGNVTAYSDPRLKENVQNISSALEKVTSLNGVKFTWKQNSLLGKPGCEDYGILANEVKAIAPELISPSIKDENGISYDTVAYDKLIPFLIEAIKELKAEVDELKARG